MDTKYHVKYKCNHKHMNFGFESNTEHAAQ